MASKGATGKGAVFSIGSSPVAVGQVKTIQLSGQKVTYDDLTNLGSPSMGTSVIAMEEKLPAKASPGTVALSFIFLPGDAGYLALVAAYKSQVLEACTIQLPIVPPQTTTGNLYSFSGFISELPMPDVQFDKTMMGKVTIELNTDITITSGS